MCLGIRCGASPAPRPTRPSSWGGVGRSEKPSKTRAPRHAPCRLCAQAGCGLASVREAAGGPQGGAMTDEAEQPGLERFQGYLRFLARLQLGAAPPGLLDADDL